jgi:glycine dehydrogenase
MISIREEIREIEEEKADKENNVIKNAPHTAANGDQQRLGQAIQP